VSVNIVVGARFNAGLTAKTLLENDVNFQVYSSSPRKYWSLPPQNFKFIPMPLLIANRVLGVPRPVILKELDARIFDFMTSKLIEHKEILHGWASFCRMSGTLQKKRGGALILDRACPHIIYQCEQLQLEADTLGVAPDQISISTKRCMEEEYDLADIIVVPSKYTYHSFIKKGIEAKKLRIAPLDANFLMPSAKTDVIHRSTDIFTIGFIGGNLLRKGLIYLLKAWKALGLKNAKLLLKTSKSELYRYPEIIQILSSTNTIEVVGYVNDIKEFYARCDAFCLPSIDDGFGMVVLEALSCGLPVITTTHVGASEFVQNFKNGFVYPPRDVTQLMSLIFTLYNDHDLLKVMSENALKTYQEYIESDETYSKSIMNIYKEIIT
jgi:glycosyltransferase involved in cell wall biosynthesis